MLYVMLWLVFRIGETVAVLSRCLPIRVRTRVVNGFIEGAVEVIARTAGA